MKRLGLYNLARKKLKFNFNTKTSKLSRGKRGSIDWQAYREKILLPKLFPFAKECAKARAGTLVQEDKAPAHSHYIQQRIYDLHGIKRLLQVPNSPDLNLIEPAQFYLKRETTKKGALKS